MAITVAKQKVEAKKQIRRNKSKELIQMPMQQDKFLRQLALKMQFDVLGDQNRDLTEDEHDYILDQLADRKTIFDSEPLKYFCPNIAQERMIKAFVQGLNESKISTVMVTSANGVGKTTTAINIIGNLVFGVQNKWFNYDIFKNFPYPKQIWLITTPNNLKTNYFSENLDAASFNYWFKGHKWVAVKDGKTHYTKITFPDNPGWVLNILTYYQDLSEFESATVGGFLLDEPCPENIWNVLPARLRKGGFYFMPMTPLDCDPYIKEEVMDKADAGVLGYKYIEASAYEVCSDKERGHLDKDVLNAQIEKYNEDEIQARVYGKLMYFKERIIDNWNNDIHFVRPQDYPILPNYQLFHIVDPADGRPNAEIWGAVTPEGRRIIFQEAPLDQSINFWEMKGAMDMDRHIKFVEHLESSLEMDFGFPVKIKKRIFDYHFSNQTRGVFKKNLITEYRKAGWKISESYKGVGEDELPYGHRKIREALRIMPDGKPGLVVWNTCFHVQNAITKYVRKRPKTEADLMKPAVSGQIIEKYKDFVDIVRYFICDNYRITIEETEEEKRRKIYNASKQNENLNSLYDLF